MIEGFVLVIVFEQPSALSRDPKDPKFLLAASPPPLQACLHAAGAVGGGGGEMDALCSYLFQPSSFIFRVRDI